MSKWRRVKPPSELLVRLKLNTWFFKMTSAWENDIYIVLSRQVANVEHVAICRKDSNIVTWAEKQNIKNELFGDDRTAIEIYPPSSELIDDNNVFHLWVYERGYKIPFSLM